MSKKQKMKIIDRLQNVSNTELQYSLHSLTLHKGAKDAVLKDSVMLVSFFL